MLERSATFSPHCGRLATTAYSSFGDDSFSYSVGALSQYRSESELAGTVVVSLVQNRMRSGADVAAALASGALTHEGLASHLASHIWTLGGDYYTYTYSSGVIRASQQLLTAAPDVFPAGLTRDSCLAWRNCVPVLGMLHCALNAIGDDWIFHEALLRRFWTAVHGKRRLAQKPKPERLHGLLVLVFASWLLVRKEFLECVGSSTDAQVLYFIHTMEFHIPLSVMMYVVA